MCAVFTIADLNLGVPEQEPEDTAAGRSERCFYNWALPEGPVSANVFLGSFKFDAQDPAGGATDVVPVEIAGRPGVTYLGSGAAQNRCIANFAAGDTSVYVGISDERSDASTCPVAIALAEKIAEKFPEPISN